MVGCKEGWAHIGPKSTLALLMAMMFLLSSDKAAVSGILDTISEDFKISAFEAGLLGSAFILGYLIAGPLSAHFSQYLHPYLIMLISLSVYLLAVLGCAISDTYGMLISFRSLTGAGESGVLTLGAPIIIAVAPKNRKSLWLALLYMSNAIGGATGAVVSSVLNSAFNSWKLIFVFEAIAILPFMLILLLVYKDPGLMKCKSPQEVVPFKEQFAELLNTPVFILVCFAFAAVMFFVGGYIFWAPTLIHEMFGLSMVRSSMINGSIATATGLLGSSVGSILFDRHFKQVVSRFDELTEEESDFLKCREACLVAFYGCVLSCIFGGVAVAIDNLYVFLTGISLMMLSLFAIIGTISVAYLTAVRDKIREQANAVNNVVFRVFGDFPAPYLIGLVIDASSYRWGAVVAVMWTAFAVFTMAFAWFLSVIFK